MLGTKDFLKVIGLALAVWTLGVLIVFIGKILYLILLNIITDEYCAGSVAVIILTLGVWAGGLPIFKKLEWI